MSRSILMKRRITPFQLIIIGFAGLILLGALVLMLPLCSQGRQITSFGDALFTATSAVCVTGLVVQDTASYWSGFGQAIILLLIQIGGLGVITVAASFAILSGRNISLKQRSAMQEAIAAPQMGGVVRLTGFILRMTLAIEVIGALVMLPAFCQGFGARGIWMSFFHSISAFCNAGFDLMGTAEAPYVSLMGYASHPVINVTIMLLIVIGGIGFLTWDDVRTKGIHLRRYRMQSKVILVMTTLLILFPALYFFFGEFAALPLGSRLTASLFQSVTPRTAGFNTVDLTQVSDAGQTLIILLMLIGGSPGSTAGGMKTTTAAVLIANALAVFGRREAPHIFGRRLEESAIRSAATILMMYLCLFLAGGWIISLAEGLPMGVCLFEAASAIGTVGLSLGLTPGLGMVSRIVLIVLMFFGRVGGLTLIYAALSTTKKRPSKLPQDKITVG